MLLLCGCAGVLLVSCSANRQALSLRAEPTPEAHSEFDWIAAGGGELYGLARNPNLGLYRLDKKTSGWIADSAGLPNGYLDPIASTDRALYVLSNSTRQVFKRRLGQSRWEQDGPQIKLTGRPTIAALGNTVVADFGDTYACQVGDAPWKSVKAPVSGLVLGTEAGIFLYGYAHPGDPLVGPHILRIDTRSCAAQPVAMPPGRWKGILEGKNVPLALTEMGEFRLDPNGGWAKTNLPPPPEAVALGNEAFLLDSRQAYRLRSPGDRSQREVIPGVPYHAGLADYDRQGRIELARSRPGEMFFCRESSGDWHTVETPAGPPRTVVLSDRGLVASAFQMTADGSRPSRIMIAEGCGTDWRDAPIPAGETAIDLISLGSLVWAITEHNFFDRRLRRFDSNSQSHWDYVTAHDRIVYEAYTTFAEFNGSVCALNHSGEIGCWDAAKSTWVMLENPPLPERSSTVEIRGNRTLWVFGGHLVAYQSKQGSVWQIMRLGSKDSDSIEDAWRDPDDPSVFVISAGGNLFWTNDTGGSYHEVRGPPGVSRILKIVRTGGEFRFATNNGLYSSEDHIPRGAWWKRAWGAIEAYPELAASIAGIAFLLLFGSTSLILKFLVWEVRPVALAAEWFYSMPLGRWRLYRTYRRKLQAKHRGISERYVELPISGSEEGGSLLSQSVASKLSIGPVFVEAPGGRGKTTLCEVIAFRGAAASQVPVIIRGAEFNGNLVDWLQAELTAGSAWVTRRIVESQLRDKVYLLIFDAFSDANLDRAALLSLATSLRAFGLQRCLMTSRAPFDAQIGEALGEVARMTVPDVTPNSEEERNLLAAYLRGNLEERNARAERIQPLIDKRFPGIPRIPLLLRLIAEVYDNAAIVPENRVRILELYVNQALNRTASKECSVEGLFYAIRLLTAKSFLATAGKRRGFTYNWAIDLLHSHKEDLAARNVTLSAIDLLDVLVRSGLYQRNRNLCAAWHPLQEEYFAARVLDLEMDESAASIPPGMRDAAELAPTWELLQEMRPKDDMTGAASAGFANSE